MANTFGTWIQALRQAQKMDLRSVGNAARIHFTTIGRIEKGNSEPTLDTAIKITTALGGDPAELYYHLTGNYPALPHPDEGFQPVFPTEQDLLLVERLISEKPKTTAEYIANLLNKITELSRIESAPDPKTVNWRLINEDEERLWLDKTLRHPFYAAPDIHKYLLHYPEYVVGSTISSPRLNYPKNIDIELLLQAYLQGAVLIREDIIRYVMPIFDDLAPETYGNRDAMQKMGRVEVAKDKLSIQDQISSAKIGDALIIDQALSGDQYEIFMMMWNAAKEEIRRQTMLNEVGISRLLIVISRFLAAENNPMPDWLSTLRSM